MKYKTSLLLMFMLNGVWSTNCGTENLKNFFDGGVSQCSTEETWTYSQFEGNSNVSDFLAPGLGVSCISSHIFPINSGDYIEVNIFTESIAKEDFVTVIVYDAVENKVLGKATLSSDDAKNGWNIVKILLDGPGSFNGYIMLTGEASLNSVLLVGSICYSTKVQPKLKEDTANLTSRYTSPTLNIYELQTGSYLNLESDVIVNGVELNDPENRAGRFIENFSWTPLTIGLAVAIPVVILFLLAWGCYALGKCRGAKREPEIIYEDVNNIPKPYLVPRVKNVYAESVNGSTYGGRNNNIYSV